MELVTPCQVIFENQWHPAVTKTLQNEREFELKKVELSHKEYSTTKIEKNDILEKFRVGRGHNTNFPPKIMDDPFDVAQAAYEHYCTQNV